MRRAEIKFLTLGQVIKGHAIGLARAGGQDGIRDKGLIKSAVMAPKNGYYGSLAELAAVYTHGVAKNHPFLDGNKRAAFMAGMTFLGRHGFKMTLDEEWIGHIERLAAGELSREELTALFTAAMGGDPIALE